MRCIIGIQQRVYSKQQSANDDDRDSAQFLSFTVQFSLANTRNKAMAHAPGLRTQR